MVLSKNAIIKNGRLVEDAKPDGTISPDEDARRSALVEKAKRMKEDLKREAYEIGGSFRGPGIFADVMKVLRK